MNLQRIAAITLIIGFVLVIAASLSFPGKVYQETDVDRRLALLAESMSAWRLTNVLFALSGIVTAVGLAMLSAHLQKNNSLALLWIGAGAFALGALAYVIYSVERTVDPASFFKQNPITPIALAAFWLFTGALAVYGAAFVTGSAPNWLGIVDLVFAALMVAGAAILRYDFFFICRRRPSFW